MLWIILKEESLQITSCNTFDKDGLKELWVERSNGKSRKLKESDVASDIAEYKSAIDWAIKNGHKTLEL